MEIPTDIMLPFFNCKLNIFSITFDIDILALFLRRGEKEVIVLDETKPKFIEEIEVE